MCERKKALSATMKVYLKFAFNTIYKLAYVKLPKKFFFHVQLVIQVSSLAGATLQYEFYCFYANFDFIAIKQLLLLVSSTLG